MSLSRREFLGGAAVVGSYGEVVKAIFNTEEDK